MPPTERTLEKVLKKAKRIWKEEGRPFSYFDFKEYKPSYFRKIMSLLSRRGDIVRWQGCRSKPQLWVPALKENENWHGGFSETLLEILESLNWESLRIHDIRLRVYSQELCNIVFGGYSILQGYGFSSRKDGSIVSPPIRWGRLKKRKTNAVFYRSGTIIVEVSCSCDPIPADEIGLRFFTENLVDLRRRLLRILYRMVESASIPLDEYLELPETWIVAQVHINRDANSDEGLRLDNIPTITLMDFSRTLRLYYHRKLCKIRAEAVVHPEISLKEFFKRLGLHDLGSTNTPFYIT